MGFRFRKTIKIAPGLKLNLSKSGISTSLGGKGLTANFSKRGIRGTVGLPGSGMSYSTTVGKKPRRTSSPKRESAVAMAYESDAFAPTRSSDEAFNDGVATTALMVGLIGAAVFASFAAHSVGGWFGWFVSTLVFAFVMLSLGRASAETGSV